MFDCYGYMVNTVCFYHKCINYKHISLFLYTVRDRIEMILRGNRLHAIDAVFYGSYELKLPFFTNMS